MESVDVRKIQLEQWLLQSGRFKSLQLRPLAGDASFRRYFRITQPDLMLVAMDAPPPQENVEPFIAVAAALHAWGLRVPAVLAADRARGFLLLTDFGDATYLNTLNTMNADLLYSHALIALARLQACPNVPGRTLPLFDADFMRREWAWHKEWFLAKWLDIRLSRETEKILDDSYELLVSAAASQPQVFMHRDYHSGNLMVLPNNEVGVLDFQDAFIGPLTYDLASLLRDCYIEWPEERVQNWVKYYLIELHKQQQHKDITLEQLQYWFDLMSMQRHLKALLTFARKHVRDQQSEYLQHVPRTLRYLLSVSQRYPALTELHIFLRDTIQPAVKVRAIT
jgi:aminoglycoside/choline kinase family phosphotransferase